MGVPGGRQDGRLTDVRFAVRQPASEPRVISRFLDLVVTSFDVELPKSQKPLFEDRCVVCGHDEPGCTVTLVTGPLGWWSWLIPFGKSYVVEAPACRSCLLRLPAQRVGSLLVAMAIALVVAWYVGPLLDDYGVSRRIRNLLLLGVAFAGLMLQD